jgi:GDP-4-dehydro-6-deoxy-D-mannose reductase
MDRVLVTGGSGFIGGRLVEALRRRVAVVLAPNRREWDMVADDIPAWKVDHVFHVAGLSGPQVSWQDPLRFHLVNAHGTANVAEFCRRAECSLSYVSAYCYGVPSRLPVSESDPVRPNNPYAFSKHQGEEACRFYNEYFGLPVTIIRPFNVYGPGQSDAFVLTRIVRQALDSAVGEIHVRDLWPRRDYVFVDDVVEALISTAAIDRYALFNVGSGVSHSVEEAIHTVLEASGVSKPYRSLEAPRRQEISDVVANIDAIREAVGWRPSVSFPEGVRRLVEGELQS